MTNCASYTPYLKMSLFLQILWLTHFASPTSNQVGNSVVLFGAQNLCWIHGRGPLRREVTRG